MIGLLKMQIFEEPLRLRAGGPHQIISESQISQIFSNLSEITNLGISLVNKMFRRQQTANEENNGVVKGIADFFDQVVYRSQISV